MDRILVEGYPRSGNTFCNKILATSFPKTFVPEFTHSASILSDEHFVLIREPNVAISSFMSVFAEENKDSAERWWLRFYSKALEVVKPERWIFFEDLINKTEQTIEHIGNIIGVKPIRIDYSSLSKNSARESYPLYSFDEAQELYAKLKQKGQE
jgi:hypothetical protein